MRRNFETLKKIIEELTTESNNILTLKKGSADARGWDDGFYTQNIVRNAVENQFRNLEEVERYINECLK
ncbi:MAG: hypothetical protein ACRC0F_09880 [Cetobacterium sp.]